MRTDLSTHELANALADAAARGLQSIEETTSQISPCRRGDQQRGCCANDDTRRSPHQSAGIAAPPTTTRTDQTCRGDIAQEGRDPRTRKRALQKTKAGA